jgi:hypothetical protein
VHSGIEFKIDNVLIETGSAATIFALDYVRKFGIDSEPEDRKEKLLVWEEMNMLLKKELMP